MALQSLSPKASCPNCGSIISDSERHCPTCRADVGAPNVRRCFTKANLCALFSRLDEAKSVAEKNGCDREFNEIGDLIDKKSGVVISMPAGIARKLLEDPNSLYSNYESLVGSNVRKPARPESDRQRCAVGGLIFGSYAKKIMYGALSLTEEGLPTYGDIFCRLRSIAIDKRTSFLETNSYKFVNNHNITPENNDLPLGYSACWRQRRALVLAKISSNLSKGQTESDWQKILIRTDGVNRNDDDFVEAHIYEGFDKNAIESVVAITRINQRRPEKLDADIAVDLFREKRK